MSLGTSNDTPLVVTTSSAKGGSLIRLIGVIDQSLDPDRLNTGQGGVVVLDLSGVHRITSYGVREWLRALKGLSSDYLGFVGCRPALVYQFNMVVGFDGGGQLLSFYAPYICPRCDREIEELVDLRTQHTQISRFVPPPVICPQCNQAAEFDDTPESYLAYVARTAKPEPPQLVEDLLSGSAGSTNPTLRITKHVRGTVTWFRLAGTLGKGNHLKRLADGLEGDVVFSFEHVQEVTPEGLDRLQAILAAEGPNFYLTRLSPAFARALSDRPAVRGRAAVTSVLLRIQCEHCKAKNQIAISAEELERFASEPLLPCVECHHPVHPDPDQLAVARALGLSKAPEDLRSRLDSFPGGAEGTGSNSPEAFGRYQLLHRVGMGGVGEVFLAKQTGAGGFQKMVVLKRLLPMMAENPQVVEMFLQEARLAARVNHPNLVQVFDMGQQDGKYFMAMEYVRGLDLDAILKGSARQGRMLPLELAGYIVSGICAGLHAAHTFTDDDGAALGLLHRDVSPHNVLVSSDGHIKVTDFGIAKTMESKDETGSHQIKGKIPFIAPERIDSRLGKTDARSDIFSAGIVLYQCVTLKHPFLRTTQRETLKAVLEAAPTPLAKLRPDAPMSLQYIIDLALARDPTKRYPSAMVMKRDLEALNVELKRTAGSHELAEWLKGLDARGLSAITRTSSQNSNPSGINES